MLAFVLLMPASASATCVFNSISGAAFTYDAIGGANAMAAGAVSGTCDASSATDVVISLDAGLHSGGSASPWREMLDSTNDLLEYNLYLDPAHTAIWGDGTNGTATQSFAQTAGSWSYTVYGVVPSGQKVRAGSYYDTVTVTMTY